MTTIDNVVANPTNEYWHILENSGGDSTVWTPIQVGVSNYTLNKNDKKILFRRDTFSEAHGN